MSAPIRIAIRADAGEAIGTGHFARAAAIAEALLSGDDVEIVLLVDGEGAALVTSFFLPEVKIVPLASGENAPSEAMQKLAGMDWRPEVVIIDHYGRVPEWEALAREAGIRLVVIDDLDQASGADVIVRPHGGADAGGGAVILRGPAYLPLSRSITARVGPRPSSGSRLRLNVCFGGSDPTGETGKVLQAAASLEALDIDVVIGPRTRVDPALVQASEAVPHLALHRAPSQDRLAELLADADLALGAGGVMLWERLCLGVPSLVICVADNQRPQIDAMVAAGAIRFIGDHTQVTPKEIAKSISALAADGGAQRALSQTGQQLVDGRGALRLAAWTQALALGSREVKIEDAANLFAWRTDERNWQYNWDGAEKPRFDAHVAWLDAKLADSATIFRIVTRGDDPIGVVRFDLDEEGASAHLSIYLVPAWRGRKMGLPVYFAAERALRRSHPGVKRILSVIHRANTASERLHRDAGFELQPSHARQDWLEARKTID